ncbi:DNA-binding beta-propeller fold protein YncE [Cohnella sp. SGD-V74]|uniref:S-layer homology domain-containing protein n=1 Tax=unclassified Cohnella TaxID=2636738 RepID=UPI000B8C3452|nr:MULTISPECIES: S-layer homology domain-containing protein [unclassified Cohnella]PRX59211.1 DNA-binding beta-propeller fold protein YncE [Cohnella sp. SGD-V74]
MPTGVAVDGSGNMYVADFANHRIQKLTQATNTWSEWGKAGGGEGSGLGEFNAPVGVAVDNIGNVYVAELGNHRIQKLTVSTNTWSEWGKSGGGPGDALGEFNTPIGVAVDSDRNVYVADYSNHRVQKLIVSTNTWSEWKKSDGGSGSDLGEFNRPSGVAVDGSGNVYVADSGNHRVQKLTLSGNAWSEWVKSGGGPGTGLGEFLTPTGIALDSIGNVYVTDSVNHRVQKLTVSTNGWSEWKKSGAGSGIGLGEFDSPFGIAVDGNGNMYVADSTNNRIQKLEAATDTWSQWSAMVSGSGSLPGEFHFPFGIAVGGNGDVYVTDGGNNRIQKLTLSANAWNEWGKAGGDSGTDLGEFTAPLGVAVDGDENVYVADFGNHRIQKLTRSTNTWSGWGAAGGGAGGGLGEFFMPAGVAVDGSGNVYVADLSNHRIQKLTVSTNTWSEWGKVGGGSGSGPGEFNDPSGVAVDGNGNIYVADSGNHRIQKLTLSTNTWSEWGKIGGGLGSGPGEFFTPTGVAVDGGGNVYVADSGNHRIQRLTVSTNVWSEWGKLGGGSGGGLGEFKKPFGIAVDGSGGVYVSDNENHRIQKLTIPATPIADFASVAKTSATATFNWTAASGATALRIEQSPAGANAWTAAETGAIAAHATSATVTGLSASTAYDFRLVVTGGSNAGISNTAVVTTDGVVPGAPVLQPPVAGNAEVELAWSPVAGAAGYKVFQSATPGTHGTEITTVSDSVYRYTVTGLTNGTTYYFAVMAINSLGDSEASPPVSATPATVPAAPDNVTAVAGNGRATVSFTAPADHGGSAITGYEVTASPGNIVVTGTASPITVTGLTNGTSYTFIVKAINRVGSGAPSTGSDAVVPSSPTGGSNTPSQPTAPSQPATPPSPSESNFSQGVILVNGKAVNAGTATTGNRNGQTVIAIALDQNKLSDILATEGQHAVVTISLNAGFDVIVIELNGETVNQLEDKQAVLQIKKDRATYTVPAQQINLDSVRDQIGQPTALQDIKLQIEVAKSPADRVKVAENAAAKGTFELVAPPVDFTIRALYGHSAIQVSRFNAYVERTIALPDGVRPNRISTGVVVDPDGTVRHVPTKIVVKDGGTYAIINSLTNSTYSVVWKPVEFRDMANHWAEDAVNDMGTRLILEGTGGDRFSPDRNITRAEFAAIIVRGLGLEPVRETMPFTDAAPSDWYGSAISTAYAHELINGSKEGAFRPHDRITREEAMAIIARAMKITGLKAQLPVRTTESALRPYADAADASAWARSGIADCIQAGIVSGRGRTQLAPKAYMTRAEVAAIVQRLLQKSDLI